MPPCSIDFIKLIKEVMNDSGRGLFHRGHYYDCLEQPEMKYSFVQFGMNGQDLQVFTGLCLPMQCSDSLIEKSLNSALKIIGIPVNILYIDSNTNDYTFQMTWVSYLTMFILITIGILVFVATVQKYNRKKEDKNEWLDCFDIVSNTRQHFKVRQGQDLNVLDGVRSMAMMWVVFGHSFTFFLNGIINMSSITIFANKSIFLLIQAGILSVDTFFALGGFFLAFIMLRYNINVKACGLGILHRVLRIWPAYIIAMLFYYSLFMRVSSGLFWHTMQKMTYTCDSMWKQVIFVSNFVDNGLNSCLGWGWYLQVDFQLFLVGVLLIYIYSKKRWASFVAAFVLIALSVAFNFVYTQYWEIKVMTDIQETTNQAKYMQDVYIKPYGRCIPYLMGLMFGILYMEYRKQGKSSPSDRKSILSNLKVKLSQHNHARIAIEWLGIFLMALVVFIPRSIQQGSKWPQIFHSLYWIASKVIFMFGLLLTILPSCLGVTNSFFNLTLNSKLFVFIARISYCTYLLHIMIVYGFIETRSYDIYYSLLDQLLLYLGLLVICLFFGFVMTVTIEVPFGNLLKSMFCLRF